MHFSDILFGLKSAFTRIYPGVAGQGLRVQCVCQPAVICCWNIGAGLFNPVTHDLDCDTGDNCDNNGITLCSLSKHETLNQCWVDVGPAS